MGLTSGNDELKRAVSVVPIRPRSWQMTVHPQGQRENLQLQEGRKQPHLVHPRKKGKQLRIEGSLRGTVGRRQKGGIEVPGTLREAKGQTASPDLMSPRHPGVVPIRTGPKVVQKTARRRKALVVGRRKDRVPGKSARREDHRFHVSPSVNQKVGPIAALERTRSPTRRAPGLVRLVPLVVGQTVAGERKVPAVVVAVEKVVIDPL